MPAFNVLTLIAHVGFNRPATYFKQPLPMRRAGGQ
jgi:hypothetical protein